MPAFPCFFHLLETPSTTLPRTGESGLVCLFLTWEKHWVFILLFEVGYVLRMAFIRLNSFFIPDLMRFFKVISVMWCFIKQPFPYKMITWFHPYSVNKILNVAFRYQTNSIMMYYPLYVFLSGFDLLNLYWRCLYL